MKMSQQMELTPIDDYPNNEDDPNIDNNPKYNNITEMKTTLKMKTILELKQPQTWSRGEQKLLNRPPNKMWKGNYKNIAKGDNILTFNWLQFLSEGWSNQ